MSKPKHKLMTSQLKTTRYIISVLALLMAWLMPCYAQGQSVVTHPEHKGDTVQQREQPREGLTVYPHLNTSDRQQGVTATLATASLNNFTLKVNGSGVVKYEKDSVRNATKAYQLPDGSSVTITMIPDKGYRVWRVIEEKYPHLDEYTTWVDYESIPHEKSETAIKSDFTFYVYFEKIPDPRPNYTITITSDEDYGYTVVDGKDTLRNETRVYTRPEGTEMTLKSVPDEGHRVLRFVGKYQGFAAQEERYFDYEPKTEEINIGPFINNMEVDACFDTIPKTRPIYSVNLKSNGTHGWTELDGMMLRDTLVFYKVPDGTVVSIAGHPEVDHRVDKITYRWHDSGLLLHNIAWADDSPVSRTLDLQVRCDVDVDVYFEKIPGISRTFTVSLSSHGEHGRTVGGGNNLRNASAEVLVEEDANFVYQAYPDAGYRVARFVVKKQGMDAEIQTFNDKTSTWHKGTLYDLQGDASVAVYFEKIPQNDNPYLQLQQGDEGSTDFQIPSGGYTTLKAKAEKGWRLHSASYNGVDVTSDVASEKGYDTGDITDNVLLYVVYEEENPSAIADVNADDLHVVAQKGCITINGLKAGSIAIVYTLDGKTMREATSNGKPLTITLPPNAVYILRTEGRTFKIKL